MKDNMTNSKSDKLSSIILIIPYFGKFPNYFQLFLNSCGNNSSINWLIVTDNEEPYNYPSNVEVEHTSFTRFQERVQQLYDFSIGLSSYSKICDFRPAFGEIFKEEIHGFDFWGFCDCDLIFGDIRHFMSEDRLSQYDKIGDHGHLTLFRNNKENNKRYKLPIKTNNGEIIPYIQAFSNSSCCIFDEWDWYHLNDDNRKMTINDIYKRYSFNTDYKTQFADLTPFTDRFIEISFDSSTNSFSYRSPQYYQLIEGKLYTYIGKQREERLYVHFLKRKMSISKELSLQENSFVMVPNSFVPKFNVGVKMKSNLLRLINPHKKQRDYKVLKGKLVKLIRKIQAKS